HRRGRDGLAVAAAGPARLVRTVASGRGDLPPARIAVGAGQLDAPLVVRAGRDQSDDDRLAGASETPQRLAGSAPRSGRAAAQAQSSLAQGGPWQRHSDRSRHCPEWSDAGETGRRGGGSALRPTVAGEPGTRIALALAVPDRGSRARATTANSPCRG